MKPCPFRATHEWEWEQARQGWLCRNCYAFTDKREEKPLVAPPTGETQSDIPTPAEPMPALPTLVWTGPTSQDDERELRAKYGIEGYDTWQVVVHKMLKEIARLETRVLLLELRAKGKETRKGNGL